MITKVDNKNKHHNACDHYYHLHDRIENGYPQHYLFTKDELIDARRRALKNTEDFPKKSLIKWFKSLF